MVLVFDPLSWVSDFDYLIEAEILAGVGVELVVPKSREERESRQADATVVVAAGLEPVTAEDIAAMRSCVGIVAAQVGVDHIDLSAAREADLAVVNVVASTEEVADHAMALVLSALRRVVSLDRLVRDGTWDPLDVAERSELRRIRGQVMGIIGPGRVGRAVAARAQPFGFEVLATARTARPGLHTGTRDPDTELGMQHVPLDRLLEISDVIVVTADANPSSIGLLGSDQFGRMKDGVVIVNVSRGSLIDEAALAAAIESGRVSHAALDVRDPEPPSAETDGLTGHPDVTQTPHIAGASREAREELHRLTAIRVLEVLAEAGLVDHLPEADEDTVDVSRVHDVDELEDIARRRLPAATYGYVAGGAGKERSVRRNRESLDSVRLVPRVMRDVDEVSTSTNLLGTEAAFPLIVAPSAVQRLSHPEGELATARAVRDAGLTMILSMNASTTMEDVSAVGVPFWMQLYFSSDRAHMASVLERAEEAGALALCLTVDHAGMPTRLRELHDPLVIPPEVEFVHLARDPALRGIDRTLTWDVIEWIRRESRLPIVLKGLLHPEDGRIASEQGVDALIVSNHGGRQLDSAVSAYDVLVPFLEAVDDSVQVYADGGIRSGNDLLKVLALGARAGLVGRPIWWGLASAGEAGVGRVLELIRTELEETMRLCGVSSVELISPEILFDAL